MNGASVIGRNNSAEIKLRLLAHIGLDESVGKSHNALAAACH